MPGQVISELETHARAEDAYLPFQFMNNAPFSQDVIAHYGEGDVERLREVEAKYDPKRNFKTLMLGGSKIPEA